ncbi:MAG: KamA family radical SAM protein, partial [Candidatus Poribacteria bacterium]
MEEWRRLIKETITDPEELAQILDVDIEEIKRVHEEFPLRVNPYYLSLIQEKGDPIWEQVIPDIHEIVSDGLEDPLAEEEDSPVPGVVHRYPDRVLFYVSYMCPVYCRFCTRKRKVGDPRSIPKDAVEMGLEYIRYHPEVRDVIVSGGDPLMLADRKIESILSGLRAIEHVEIIRIGSRVPVALPQRITPELCDILKKYHPLYLNTHFNHPREITPQSKKACEMLADAGIPLGNQSVLLKGVNDDAAVMKELVQKLLTIRVRPYYIYQADLVMGTDHFRTSVQKGLEL